MPFIIIVSLYNYKMSCRFNIIVIISFSPWTLTTHIHMKKESTWRRQTTNSLKCWSVPWKCATHMHMNATKYCIPICMNSYCTWRCTCIYGQPKCSQMYSSYPCLLQHSTQDLFTQQETFSLDCCCVIHNNSSQLYPWHGATSQRVTIQQSWFMLSTVHQMWYPVTEAHLCDHFHDFDIYWASDRIRVLHCDIVDLLLCQVSGQHAARKLMLTK